MKRAERLPDLTNLLRLTQEDLSRRLRVAMPCIVESVDWDARPVTCTAQPCITEPIAQQDGSTVNVTPGLLVDVPLVFMGGGGLVATFPVHPGDEIIVVFCDRDTGPWMQSGGVQNPFWSQKHHLSDAVGIAGIPRTMSAVSSTSAQLRTTDGTAYIELTNAGVINLVGPVNVTGALTVNGNVATTGTLKNNSVDVGSDHVHVSGAEGSDTGVPKAGP